MNYTEDDVLALVANIEQQKGDWRYDLDTLRDLAVYFVNLDPS